MGTPSATIPRTKEEKKLRAQSRAKARRLDKKAQLTQAKASAALAEGYKPLEEWDEEELSRGRPRAHNGRFSGPKPTWLTRAIAEEAVRRFQEVSQQDMRRLVPKAIRQVELILDEEGVDRRGRPLIPVSVKFEAAKWVVEHLVGKPTQRVEADISVKLQSVLANVMVTPDQVGLRPAIELDAVDDAELDDDGD